MRFAVEMQTGALLRLLFECGLIGLLIMACVMAIRVDRRLTALKRGSHGLSQAVNELTRATREAETTLARLRLAAQHGGPGPVGGPVAGPVGGPGRATGSARAAGRAAGLSHSPAPGHSRDSGRDSGRDFGPDFRPNFGSDRDIQPAIAAVPPQGGGRQ